MKKTTGLKRSAPLRRTSPLKPSGETKRKKVERQQDYYDSPVWAKKRVAALARAGHRCEYLTKVEVNGRLFEYRCMQKDHLQVHHKTNIRFGGDEIPEDLQVLCAPHHNYVERTQFPHRVHRFPGKKGT